MATDTNRRGFTIVELLVVIVVMGILLAVTIFGYSLVQKQSRDDLRSTDVALIQNALERYFEANGEYPAVCSADDAYCSATLLTTPLKPYLDPLPADPLGSAQSYTYVRRPIDASHTRGYGIRIQYESQPLCKTGRDMKPTWWSNAPACD